MQNKNITRDMRRHYRARAIQHAFEIYWHKWAIYDAYYYNQHRDELITLEDNSARFSHEDNYRVMVEGKAKKYANHLCACSCYMCTHHKKYERTHQQLQLLEKEIDDAVEVLRENGGE